jgi:DNA-binding CsgD family transcriptional regulator
LWLDAGGSAALPDQEIVAACAGTDDEPAAHVAARVSAALTAVDVHALRSLNLADLQPPESLHVGMQVVRALLRLGDGAGACDVAARVADGAADPDHTTWAGLARVEGAWAAYLLDGDERVLADVAELVAGVLAEPVRDRGQALLRLGMIERDVTDSAVPEPRSAVWAAVAAEAALAVDDLDAVMVPAATAGVPASDPITALLAGPAWIAASVRHGLPGADLAGYPLLAAEAASADPPDTARLLDLAEAWRSVAVRGTARCLLAAATAEARARAAELAMAAGLVRWAARAGARPTIGSGPLTPRELQVLELVGAGCTTPMIARRLALAESTVETHVKSAKLKLGASTRADAVARLS